MNILSGVHGTAAGVMTADAGILAEDVAAYRGIEGVTVHNLVELLPTSISELLNGPGTTIGAFCNSGACLAPFMGL